MKKAFTLLEMIFVIVISGVLSIGSYKAMQALFLRSAKAKAVTDMTLRSQIVLDQIGVLLYDRVPNSVIGYDKDDTPVCQPINELTSSKPTLEWLATMNDELINSRYDGFIDMGQSDRNTQILVTPDINSSINNNDINLIFSGAFDEGTESLKACNGAFGWHTNNSNLSFDVTINDNNISITDARQPEYIYEKYYLSKTAYAITRGKDIDRTTPSCVDRYSFLSGKDFNNTLFLFYDYQPYRGETFCADAIGVPDGNVSVLATDVSGFEAVYINDTIRINLDMNRIIRGSNSSVHITKQKVIF